MKQNYTQYCHKRIFVFILVLMMSGILIQDTDSVDSTNFKKCSQSSFCQRQRSYKPETSPYAANFDSLRTPKEGQVSIDILNTKNNQPFVLDFYALEDGMFNVKINEANPLHPRYIVPDTILDVNSQKFVVSTDSAKQIVNLQLAENPNIKITLTCSPLRLDVFDDDEPVFSLNSRHLLNIEHLRQKPVQKPKEPDSPPPPPEVNEEGKSPENEESEEQADAHEKEVVEEPVVEEKAEEEEEKEDEDDVDGMWEETFKTHQDNKPRGPESIGLDTSFINFAHVYGVPEHADHLSLRSTVGSEPYRLYNLDVFEYELDSTAALYGSIPFMIGHNGKRTVGMLWLNSAETWVDVDSSEDNKGVLGTVFGYFAGQETVPEVNVHWMSESGIIDVYFTMGPTPADVMRQYTKLTGTSYFPPMWASAYHQCRWNYKDEDDVRTVDQGFDEHDIPYDCLWLDIEHTDGKRYFTWDSHKFPNPVEMQNALAARGRKMVTIIDPHIKVDSNYHIYSDAQAKDFFVKDRNGAEFKGWCWSGDSSYLDFTKPEVREWWASRFSPEIYKGSTPNLFTWNDMNEPSVFNGPEMTMHKDCKHAGGWEHRHVHNLYGRYQVVATVDGQLARSDNKERTFVLTRAFFAGSQRYGAIWTGDNAAEWGHIEFSVPMILTVGLCGIAHAGADVGGFFKNVDGELITRWYQAGAYQPFFRAHGHIDTTRREPWLFEEKYRDAMRSAVRARYELLPYWYTLFYQSHTSGEPPMRPLWYEFPKDRSLFAHDKSYMVGRALLVQPVVAAGVTYSSVYLPGNSGWYDTTTYQSYPSPNTVSVSTPLTNIAVFQRGGTIVPRKLRVRRCSSLMTHDPYTFHVALDHQGRAEGELFMDDGHTYEYKNGKYNYKKLVFENKVLSSRSLNSTALWETNSWLERVVIMGISKPSSVQLESEGRLTTLGFTFDPNKRLLTIRKPAVKMQKDWTITLS
ncbi:neutral alpha-glucosidase AB-like isoform X2 [Clavelina lepadiformis]|uniref:neutral alpha-glucosidase AB-like isoform X2 n=1 Tax=Clavelina lepadiformis TaxID=159417 RepID=UPI0040413867